jgi:hypothetical protein
MSTRGIRNHNPGNIKDFDIPWKGILADDDRDADQKAENTFVVFCGPWWGIRAMAITIRNYSRRHGLQTIEGIIRRWAPAGDINPTDDYIEFVADAVGVHRGNKIDVEDFQKMRKIVQAIVRFENGEDPYTWQYEAGLILAGIEPKAEMT